MEPTISFRDLMILLTTSGVAVGAASAFLTGLLWRFLAEVWPGGGYTPAENVKRVVSLMVPFALVLVGYAVLVAQGQTVFNEETLWAVIYLAVVSITGKQIAFAGYRAVRPPAPPQA